MASFTRDLVFLILQFLEEEKLKGTVHKLERESGFFFNMKYFEDVVTNGQWDEVEKYLSGFTKVDDNRHSMKIFFEIRKQKYLEALDKHDQAKAVEILVKDLKVFSTFNEEIFKEITLLLTLGNFRENEQLSKYGDTNSARAIMLVELKRLIQANPIIRDKLQFPTLKNSRLRTLINQSLNWQHQLCKSPNTNPDIKTLFVDHNCGQPNGAQPPSLVTNPLMGAIPKGVFPPVLVPGPFQSAPALTASLAGWMTNSSSVPHQAVSVGPIGLNAPNNAASMLKRAWTPPNNNLAIDYQTANLEHLKRSRTLGVLEEVNNMLVNILPAPLPGQSYAHTSYPSHDLPKTVMVNLTQGSAVKSMDFNPVQQTLLLVGTSIGDITVWEVGSRERLAFRNFKVWDIASCSMTLQASLANEYTASVNRVLWSPDGTLFGIAYSKHIVHVYSYNGGDRLRNHLEIDAHIGNVSDLAFADQNEQLCIITCGEDKAVKVWDAVTGLKKYMFEGHEAPVYCVCPHQKENIQFIFSTSIDGKIKAWLYDNIGSRVNYDAPGHSCTTMAYSTDGTRLFSCGTSKAGESYIVEWNESEGTVKRTYRGLAKQPVGVVQFDTTKNRFLAAGDEFLVKFWDMDNVNLLTTADAEGGLLASPCIRFNKEGLLLAVSTCDNGIKILANTDGCRLLRSIENRLLDASRVAAGSLVKAPIVGTFGASSSTAGTSAGIADRSASLTAMVGLNGDSRSFPDMKPRTTEDSEKSKNWKLAVINKQSQLCSLRLPDNLLPVRIIRLIYTNSGCAILALAHNAVHKLWKWQRSERNPMGKATSVEQPQLWQPSSGILMTNEMSEKNLEDAVPCFALSKNDSYVMSASGGTISLFNMTTFKKITTFLPPPPAATYIAFHPLDNNFIAIGMEDASIRIYNVPADKLCVWSTAGWEKKASKFLEIPTGRVPAPLAQTRVQFHQDQIHVLAVHETHIGVYEAPKLECLNLWVPPTEPSGLITDATYSCDSQAIYASFEDGSVCVLNAERLILRCRINCSAYLPSNPSSRVYPLVIAAHPSEPNQFALGLTDGGVHVLQPLESVGKWGTVPPLENGDGLVIIPADGSEQQR
ncbi:topless-related protein 4-like isoform X2 [Malania oleifera]|uniref:topless-related protein 4-like isoform X2 n=1 Tax=Malania oleifera TaxID=397392 RepID=UPI0025AEA98A|nr:topless-related protein 4-like isoform X2 [Malania oleifera]